MGLGAMTHWVAPGAFVPLPPMYTTAQTNTEPVERKGQLRSVAGQGGKTGTVYPLFK